LPGQREEITGSQADHNSEDGDPGGSLFVDELGQQADEGEACGRDGQPGRGLPHILVLVEPVLADPSEVFDLLFGFVAGLHGGKGDPTGDEHDEEAKAQHLLLLPEEAVEQHQNGGGDPKDGDVIDEKMKVVTVHERLLVLRVRYCRREHNKAASSFPLHSVWGKSDPGKEVAMKGMARTILSFMGASLGWWIGAPLGTIVALLLSSVGTGFGLYYGRKLVQD
jgi:hypothetical protein